MTPGQAALIESMRLEAAAVYGRHVPEHRSTLPVPADADQAALDAALARVALRREQEDREIVEAIRAGLPVSVIVDRYGVDYAEVRAVRKRLMKGAA